MTGRCVRAGSTGLAAGWSRGRRAALASQAAGRRGRSRPTVTGDGAGRAEVRGEVPLEALAAMPEQPSPSRAGRPATTPRPGTCTSSRPGTGRIPVTFPEGVAEARHRSGGREIAVERARYGTVVLAERAPRPVIDSLRLGRRRQPAAARQLPGDPGAGLAAVLRCPDASMEHVLACDVTDGTVQRAPRSRGDAHVRPAAAACRWALGPVRARRGRAARPGSACDHAAAGRDLAPEGRGRCQALRLHHGRLRRAGDHRRAPAAPVRAGQLQPAGAAPGVLPDPGAAARCGTRCCS